MSDKIYLDGMKMGEFYKIAENLVNGYGTEAKIAVHRDANRTYIRVVPRELKK